VIDIRDVRCPYCDAAPGQHCRTRSGRVAGFHVGRIRLAVNTTVRPPSEVAASRAEARQQRLVDEFVAACVVGDFDRAEIAAACYLAPRARTRRP
jgi:hypothetical protein